MSNLPRWISNSAYVHTIDASSPLDEEILDDEQVSELLIEIGQASEHVDEESADEFDEFMQSLTEFDLTGFLDEMPDPEDSQVLVVQRIKSNFYLSHPLERNKAYVLCSRIKKILMNSLTQVALPRAGVGKKDLCARLLFAI